MNALTPEFPPTPSAPPRDAFETEDLRRRASIGLGRMLSTLPGRGLTRPCLFIHLPKCGGTSLSAGLAGTLPFGARLGAIDAVATRRAAAMRWADRDDPRLCHEELGGGAPTFTLREQLALTHLAWGTRLVYGHVLLSDRIATAAERCGYGVVTMMRCPVERTLSNYMMAARAGIVPTDIDAWLDSAVAVRMGAQALRYLSGRAEPLFEARALDVARALDRIAALDLVGFLDAPDVFRRSFARQFGQAPSLSRLNRAKMEAPVLTKAQARRLEEITAVDRLLYDEARRIFLAGDTRSAERAHVPAALEGTAA